MSIREQLTLAAGFAVLLGCASLLPLFDGGGWILQVLGSVVVVALVGLASRRFGVPRALQPLIGALALALYLCLAFVGSTLSYGLVPTTETYDALNLLVEQARKDIQEFGPPVPTTTALVLLSAAGVGAVALLVDFIAVVLDKAAVAGLPLLLLLAVPSAVLPGGLGWFPFVLGAVGWLSLLLVEGSERVGRWGTPMRSSLPGARPGGDDSSLGRVGRRIGLTAVGMSLLVPLVVPGLDHRLVGGSGGGGEGSGSGGSNQATTYNPITRLKDQLSLPSPRQLLIYETDDPQPDYLRMTTLDTYDGTGWEASKLQADQEQARVQDGIEPPAGDSGPHRAVKMRIAIDTLDVFWLPVPFGPTKVEVDGRWLWDPTSQTVFSASRKTKGLPPYTVEASRALPDRASLALAQINGVDPAVRRTYGGELDVAPYVEQLTEQITRGQTTPYDEAVALQAYFRNPANNFSYNLESSQPRPGEDALEAFLKGKQGFCEQYATAMAVMLRVAGIPSRVAVGFTPGAPITGETNRYQVSTDDAHAWPEAWFAGSGWVRFEPTPSQSGATVPDYSVGPVDPDNPDAVAPTPEPSAAPSQRGTGQLDPDILNPDAAPATSGGQGGSSGRSPLWVVIPLSLLVLSTFPFLLTVVRRRRRWARPEALTAWSQLEDDAADVGFRWHEADSPRAAAARLLAWRYLPPEGRAALDRIATSAELARFAPPGRLTTENLRPDVDLLRAELRDGSPARDRWRAVLFPPSTLRWAGHAIGEFIADILDKVDDAISAVTRPLRRRVHAR